jgi:hypothetical protein
MKKILLLTIFSLLFIISCNAQSIDRVSGKCLTPYTSFRSLILMTSQGDITQTPCPTRTNIFTGNVDFSAATVTGLAGVGNVSGTGTTNFVTRWTNGAGGVIGNTPLSWNGTDYVFSNTALSATFGMSLTPTVGGAGGFFQIGQSPAGVYYRIDQTGNAIFSQVAAGGTITQNSGTGIFSAGDTASAGSSTKIVITDSLQNIDVNAQTFNTQAPQVNLGDINASGNGTLFSLTDGTELVDIGSSHLQLGYAVDTGLAINRTANVFDFHSNGIIGIFDLDTILTYNLLRTITAGGTTGAQVINKPAGTVNFAAGATAITVTNSTVNTSSLINAMARTNDATCSVKNVVSGAGSFVINMTAACTAETSVAFWVWN